MECFDPVKTAKKVPQNPVKFDRELRQRRVFMGSPIRASEAPHTLGEAGLEVG